MAARRRPGTLQITSGIRVRFPHGKNLVKLAEDCGIERIALKTIRYAAGLQPKRCSRRETASIAMIAGLDPLPPVLDGRRSDRSGRVLDEHGAITIFTAGFAAERHCSGSQTACWIPSTHLPTLVELCCRRRGTRCQVVEGFSPVVRMSGYYNDEISRRNGRFDALHVDGHLAMQVLREA